MKSILTAQGKDVTKYLQKTLAELYNDLDSPDKITEFLRGEIYAIKLFLKEFGVDYELKIELIGNREEE